MASGRIRKFISRAPRYILRPQDKQVMRFSLEHSLGEGGIEETYLINLSESGVAFIINAGMEPQLGERIKIEIPIPSGEQFAWWARVVRIEEYIPSGWRFGRDPFADHSKVIVGLRFEKLPEPFSRAIRRGLEVSFIQAARDQQFRTLAFYRTLALQNLAKLILFVFLTAFTVGFIYWFTRPDANYDAKRGAPWGERFKFF